MTLVEDARHLAAELSSYTAAHERERRLAPAVVERLRAGGFLQALLPGELGGHEVALPAYVELLEALAVGDAASAWCVMTASTSTLLSGYLDPAAAREIWPPTWVPFLAGVFAPGGRVVADGGTVTLTGRWPYGSGGRHADWCALGAIAPDPSAVGGGRHVVCFVPADAAGVRIEDNWDTLGLGGTGSHDIVADGVRLPITRMTSVFERTPWPAGSLYRLPLFGVLALGIAACGLGIARAALAHVGGRLAAPPAGKAPEPSTVLARWAELHATHAAGRAYLLDVAARAAAAAAAGPVAAALRGELRLAATHVATQCAVVVRAAFHLGGGAGIRAGHPLGRALRDIETLLTHKMVADRVVPAAARAMLGLGTVPPDL